MVDYGVIHVHFGAICGGFIREVKCGESNGDSGALLTDRRVADECFWWWWFYAKMEIKDDSD